MREHPAPEDEVPLDPALARLIEGLPREAVPPAEQWASIRPRLAARGVERGRGWMPLAAAAVVLLAAVLWWRRPEVPALARGSAPTGPAPADTAARATPSAGPAPATGAERVPTAPRPDERDAWDPRVFEAALAARTDLDATTIAALRRNMAVIDSAVADSRRALQSAPADPELGALVQFGESQRRALLAQLARLQES